VIQSGHDTVVFIRKHSQRRFE